MGDHSPYLIYFTIFEDSSNGHINLFARKESVLVSSVSFEDPAPLWFNLKQNYPNPFNSTTRIFYALSKQNFVSLKIYDVLGNDIAQLVNETKVPGSYSVYFNAGNLSSGIYFYKLTIGKESKTKKMVLMR